MNLSMEQIDEGNLQNGKRSHSAMLRKGKTVYGGFSQVNQFEQRSDDILMQKIQDEIRKQYKRSRTINRSPLR